MAEWLTGSAALDRSDGTSVRRDVGAAAPYHADRDGHYRRGTRFSSARPPATVGRRARNDAGRQRRRIACIRSAGRSDMDTDKSTMARAALLFHSNGRPGKIEQTPTNPLTPTPDLPLPPSPGLAAPAPA